MIRSITYILGAIAGFFTFGGIGCLHNNYYVNKNRNIGNAFGNRSKNR